MEPTSVTSKGQITIPKEIRQELGIRKGSKLKAAIVDGHIELQLCNKAHAEIETGFAMLKSRRLAVPADFDAASLFEK